DRVSEVRLGSTADVILSAAQVPPHWRTEVELLRRALIKAEDDAVQAIAAPGFNPAPAPRAGIADGTAAPPPPPGRRMGGQAAARGRRAAPGRPRKSGVSSPHKTVRALRHSPPA